MPTLVQFGAGNIGRSFIGQIFAGAGWKVVFIDANGGLVRALNRAGSYRIVIKRNDRADETITVGGISAIDASDADAASRAVSGSGMVATSVGQQAIPKILPLIAQGIAMRDPALPLDLILAENAPGADTLVADTLSALLRADLTDRVGIVETSIGKMVPIMTRGQLAADPLVLFAEAYNTLIVDRRGFRGPVPRIPGIEAVDDIRAYVARKLYLHNLGHAAAAYFGYERNPALVRMWEVLSIPEVARLTASAMDESIPAILAEYPGTFTAAALQDHRDDLLERFQNRALGDTVYRVGRDRPRKLGREDRLVGAMRLAARHGLGFATIARAFRAALSFRACGENGERLDSDAAFDLSLGARGLSFVLSEVSGLRADDPVDSIVIKALHKGESEP